MIITNDFVMLNFPKTGSSFARKVVRRLYARRRSKARSIFEKLHICRPSFMDLMMPKINDKLYSCIKDQHGTFRQIPPAHRNKCIMSITRNPLSRYVSTYRFRWWEKFPPVDLQIILERYPHFPNLTFSEYYEMIHEYGRKNFWGDIVPRMDVGLHSLQFIQFYFKDPELVLRRIDDDYIEKDLFREDMVSDIKFIHQENLNSELKEFLFHIGFGEDELQVIDFAEKVNVTVEQGSEVGGDSACDRNIPEEIIRRDKLLFKIFPEYLPTAYPELQLES